MHISVAAAGGGGGGGGGAVFNRFVEIGRVALINYGPDDGKIVVITDIVDQNRALVDGGANGVNRQAINFKRLSLTSFKVKIGRAAHQKYVTKALEEGDILKKWEESSWGKKLSTCAKRATLSDFDRFNVQLLRQKKSNIINKEMKKIRKASQ